MTAPNETSLAERVELVKRADRAARAADPRVFQVQASYVDSLRHVLVATSDGVLEHRPAAAGSLGRVRAGARRRWRCRSVVISGGGGRVGLDFFETEKTPEHFAREAVRQAIVQFDCGAGAGR